jgi:5'-nucleotidase
MEPDAAVERLLEKEVGAVRELKGKALDVRALTPFQGAYGEESALGNLVADATRAAFPSAEIGLANGGGLRAPLPEGELRYGDLFSVLPFDNQLAVMRVNGDEVRRMIELGISGRQGALLWSGLHFSASGCAVKDAAVGGEALSPVRMYTVATSDYLAQGGSGFDSIGVPEDRVAVYWDRPYILRDLVAGVLPKWKNLSGQDFFDRANPRQKREGKCGT